MVGLLCGIVLDYMAQGRYLQQRNEKLVEQIINMRKQGFVPQYSIEQPAPLDLTKKEY